MPYSRQAPSAPIRSMVSAAIAFAALMRTVEAAGDEQPLPDVIVSDSAGRARRVSDENVYTFERDLQRLVAMPRGPKEIFALVSSAAVDLLVPGGDRPDEAREMLIVLVFENGGEARWLTEYGEKQRQWRLDAEQVKAIRDFVREHRVDELPPLDVPRKVGGKTTMVVGGTVHVYLHVGSKECRRVYINNPPRKGEQDAPADDPGWKHAEIVEFFERLKNAHRAASGGQSTPHVNERR